MNLIFKKGDRYVRAYWIKRIINRETNRTSNVLSFSLPELFHPELAKQCDQFEIHFNYPEDGKFHATLDYKIQGIHRLQHVYKDTIVAKIMYSRGISIPPIDDVISQTAGHFVNDRIYPPIKNYEDNDIFFQFPLMGVNIINNDSSVMSGKEIKAPHPSSENIVLDLDSLNDCNVSVSGFLIGRDMYTDNLKKGNTYFVVDDMEFPHVALGCVITFMDNLRQ